MIDTGAAYKEDVVFEPEYRSLATLADDPAGLTCSVTVGLRWARGRAGTVVGYPRFELAAERVRTGEHDVLLVPSAYPDIRTFFFDPELRAVDTFLGTLPDMVLAVPRDARAAELDVLFHHPATTSLVHALAEPVSRLETATSNSAACRAALAHAGRAGAVTNQTSADHYRMRTVRVLAAGTPMGFVVFTRKDPCD
jgi:hypothetical protein